MVTNLKSWLRRTPQPHSLRYTTSDDEERELQLSSNARNRWKDAADALEEMGAMRVEALDKDGKVLRVGVLREEDDRATADPAAKAEVQKSKDTAALALVLDSQGKRICEAFEKGAEAASRGQDNLVDVVQILTVQWTSTMQAVHTLSMQLAKALRAAGGSEEAGDDLQGPMQQMMGMAMMRMMGMGGLPGADTTQQPPPKTNGAKGK